MGMSEFYGTADEDEAVATIHRALELGSDFLDTADMYGRGANEKLVGKAIRGRRVCTRSRRCSRSTRSGRGIPRTARCRHVASSASAIPGTKRRRYLEENAEAVDVELSDEELERLEQAFPKGAAAGERYPDMSTIDR
jgi:aryl-alcohol dehydrogenase-like predicted oxidoreductase